MRYQVPQFIEIEDKIFGPLTLKQFLYVAGGAALGFVVWSLIPIKIIGAVIAIPLVLVFLAFAFYKYNDRPLIFTVESAFKYYVGSKLYVWNKKQKTIDEIAKENQKKKEKGEIETETDKYIPKLSDSKLRELSWSLDINENIGE